MTKPTEVDLGAGVVLVAAGAIYVKVMTDRGFSCRAKPRTAESFIALRMRDMAIPECFTTLKSPVPSTPEVLDLTRAHFADHCASCHGNDGKGNTTIGRALPGLRLSALPDHCCGRDELLVRVRCGQCTTPAPGDALARSRLVEVGTEPTGLEGMPA